MRCVGIVACCLLGLLLTAALRSAGAEVGNAEGSGPEPCPFLCFDQSNSRETTIHGAPLSASVCRVLDGQAYRFPLGYEDYWSRKTDNLDRCEEVDFLAFSFLSGSQTYPRFDRLNHAAYLLCDRDAPCSNLQYRVSVLLSMNPASDPQYFRLPSRALKNIRTPGENFREEKTPFGLEELFYPGGPRPDRTLYSVDNDREVLLLCMKESVQPINPLCSGDYYSKESGLLFFYSFPTAKLADWEAMAEQATSLILQWRL